MRKRAISVLLTALLLLNLFPTASASETVPCLTVDSSLVIIGDSNTVFLKRNNPDIQAARIYARVNATIAECASNYSRYHADGYDYGIYQLISALEGSSFRTVVINIGTNNAGTPSESYKADYRRLLNNLYEKNPDAVVYLCKILPINPARYDGPYTSVFTKANIIRINTAVEELQQEFADQGFDARIMDLNTPFENSSGVLMPEYDSGGGIHLNTAGYKRLNQVVQTALAMGDENADHSWSEEEILIPASCAETGLVRKVCTVCGAEGTDVIPMTETHSWGAGTVNVEPTCEEPGILHRICTVCGEETDEPISALGHIWTLEEVLTEGETLHACTGRYSCDRCNETKEAALCAGEVFTDMPKKSHWAHDAIDWAYFNKLTGGTSATTFSPDKIVTRSEVVTFLHTIKGRPEAEGPNPFTDVRQKDFYYDAVLWAVEAEITGGTTETTFSPRNICSREEIVMFLWAAAGRPEPESTDNRFEDVREVDYYYRAVLWAVENGITGGIDETNFGPKISCTRTQVMLFLKAAYPILTAEETPEQPEDPTEPIEPTEPEDPTEPIPEEPAPAPETP